MTANENTKTKERETHSSAKEIGVCLLCEMKALKQMTDNGQNQGKARLAKHTLYGVRYTTISIVIKEKQKLHDLIKSSLFPRVA